MSERTWREENFGSGPPCGHSFREGNLVLGAATPVGLGDEWFGSLRSHATQGPMWVRSKCFDTEAEARSYVEQETAMGRAG